jgi:hypothetical protein
MLENNFSRNKVHFQAKKYNFWTDKLKKKKRFFCKYVKFT